MCERDSKVMHNEKADGFAVGASLLPMFLAVPMTVFIADWSLLVLRSGILVSAIS